MEIPTEVQKFLVVLVEGLLTLAIPFAVSFLVVKAREIWVETTAAAGRNRVDAILSAARFAVKAAEATGTVRLIAQGYKDKREFAIRVANDYLAKHGMKDVDVTFVVDAIEAAVLELKSGVLGVLESHDGNDIQNHATGEIVRVGFKRRA